jgi:hypothetical protein
MSGLFAVVALMMITPGSSWVGPSHYYIRDLQHFATVEHCEAAAKIYAQPVTSSKFVCIEGVVPPMNGGR